MRKAVVLLWQNLNGLMFLAGGGLAYHGIAQWSSAAANVAGGVVIMAVGASGYVMRALIVRREH